MKKFFLFLIAMKMISFSGFSQESSKVDSIQREISTLQARIDSLKNEIQVDILKNGYPIITKSRYSYSRPSVILKDGEYGSALDTISIGDSIRIVDKTINSFKVLFKGKTGYISSYDIDINEYPALNYLEYSSLREIRERNSNYSTGTSTGGSVSVKGYYRKDGTYVRPHTRSSAKNGGGRRR